MKYFLDTEFIEGFHKPMFGKRRHFIDLISIGLIREDGKTYYAISNEYDYKMANDWVKKNVIEPMYIQEIHGDQRNKLSVSNFHLVAGKSLARIKDDLLHCFGCWQDTLFWRAPNEPIEIYGYYADYDWVVFCSLFGAMIDLPKGFPMYCLDLKQMMDEKVAGFSNSDFFTHFHQKEPLSFEEKLKLYKKGPNFPQQENEHNALDDARWNKKLYEYITKP
jgi:hypothetical protein